MLDEPMDSCPSTAAGAGSAAVHHHSNSFARNRRTLVGGTLVGGTLVASRHDRDIARFRAPRTATPLVSAPSFLIVNEGPRRALVQTVWREIRGYTSRIVGRPETRNPTQLRVTHTFRNPKPEIQLETHPAANARETRNPKPTGGANYTGKWQDKDGRAGRGRPKWTFRARSARPSQSPAGHREFQRGRGR